MSGRVKILVLCGLLGILPAIGRGQDRSPFIINGSPTDAFPAVGIVGELGANEVLGVNGFCTGTLISPTHVLTAAHCAQAILDFGDAHSGTFTLGDRTYFTSSVHIIPSFNPQSFTDDLAVLVLSEPVEDIQPMSISLQSPQVGDEVILVGFGGQGTPLEGSDGSFGEKLMGTTTIDVVTGTEISWEFDKLDESNPAPGDSGAPVLLDAADGILLVGIVSSGTTLDAALGDITFGMRVDAYADWITDVVLLTEIPEDPGPEEDPEDPEDPEGPGEGEDPGSENGSGEPDVKGCRRPVPGYAQRHGPRRGPNRPMGNYNRPKRDYNRPMGNYAHRRGDRHGVASRPRPELVHRGAGAPQISVRRLNWR